MFKIYWFIAIVCLIGLSGCSLTGKIKVNQPGDNNVQVPVSSANKLDLSNQGLTKVSQDIFNRTELQELDLSGNNLTGALPAEIRKLQNLRVLKAGNNQMTGLPAEIGQLEKLEILDLSNNQLTGLPYELGNLTQLKTFNISGNNYAKADLERISATLPNTQIIK